MSVLYALDAPFLGVSDTTTPIDPRTLAERVACEVTAVRGVRSLGTGRFAEELPDEAIPGVEIDVDSVRVHVVVGYPDGFPLPRLIDRVRARVRPLAAGRSVAVVIEDVVGR